MTPSELDATLQTIICSQTLNWNSTAIAYLILVSGLQIIACVDISVVEIQNYFLLCDRCCQDKPFHFPSSPGSSMEPLMAELEAPPTEDKQSHRQIDHSLKLTASNNKARH